ncbi:MAG: hypothetical protein ACRCX8_11390 [Sarcina sp.]
MNCKYKERCTQYEYKCRHCRRNPNAILRDHFVDRGYVPSCQYNYDDCVLDPAYMIYMGYRKLEDFDYDISKGCPDCKDAEWYDDEDK